MGFPCRGNPFLARVWMRRGSRGQILRTAGLASIDLKSSFHLAPRGRHSHRCEDGHPWRARPAVAPRRPVGCPGHPIWPHFRTPHPPLIYSLPPVRGAAVQLLWYSPPAPCCALLGRGRGESRARGGRCARASPPDACARAAGGSRDGLCARAPTSLQRAGRPRPLVAMEGGALLGVTAAHWSDSLRLGNGENLIPFFISCNNFQQ